MGVKVKIDMSNFNRKFSDEKLRRAHELALNDAMQAMDKYVPMKKGNLRKMSAMSIDRKSILYTAPYAKAQFYGIVNGSRVHNYTTPGTSRRWDLRLKGNKEDIKKVKEAFTNALKLDK